MRTGRFAAAAFFAVLGAFFLITGLGGRTELGYHLFSMKVSGVPSPDSRFVLKIIGIGFLVLAGYMVYLALQRVPSPAVPSPGSLTAIREPGFGRGLLPIFLIGMVLAAFGVLALYSQENPSAVVKEYIAAINRRDYAEAWAVGDKNTGMPYTKFVRGFATTAYDRLNILSVSANVVTARLIAHQTDGTFKVYQGQYMVEDCIITHFDIRQTR